MDLDGYSIGQNNLGKHCFPCGASCKVGKWFYQYLDWTSGPFNIETEGYSSFSAVQLILGITFCQVGENRRTPQRYTHAKVAIWDHLPYLLMLAYKAYLGKNGLFSSGK